jgi:hypothetical protein
MLQIHQIQGRAVQVEDRGAWQIDLHLTGRAGGRTWLDDPGSDETDADVMVVLSRGKPIQVGPPSETPFVGDAAGRASPARRAHHLPLNTADAICGRGPARKLRGSGAIIRWSASSASQAAARSTGRRRIGFPCANGDELPHGCFFARMDGKRCPSDEALSAPSTVSSGGVEPSALCERQYGEGPR